MTGAHRPRRTDSNGIPKPVVKWWRATMRPLLRCETCGLKTVPGDLALARLHVKTYPSHIVKLEQVNVTEVYAETTDGELWVKAVNGQA